MRLSALELVPVWEGSTTAQAMADALEFAREAEILGCTRIWVGEHHNTPALAASATPLIIHELARSTSSIRVGSGGMLLPNHSPLVVAEQFATLELLHPGRIDLGVGQASGADRHAAALLNRNVAGDDLGILAALLRGDADDVVVATPAPEARPPLYLLGSSVRSAHEAARRGLPYAFAHHINPADTVESLRAYREGFRPGDDGAEPLAMIAAFVVAAETTTAAWDAAAPYLAAKVLIRQGHRLNRMPATARQLGDVDAQIARDWAASQFIGDVRAVTDRLRELAQRAGADELMALTLTPDLDARIGSYRLLAESDLIRDAHASA